VKPLAPGSAVGIIGGGQLGRFLALDARRLGYRPVVLDPDPAGPAAQVAHSVIAAPLDDPDAMRALAGRVRVATYEFENINADAVAAAEALVPVYPGSAVLRVAQHRVREKATLAGHGFPVPRFAAVQDAEELEHALATIGYPAVLKTATGGYDGKGQAVIRRAEDAAAALHALQGQADTLILEEWLTLAAELSVISVRTADGTVVSYPPGENRHANGILDVTLAPAPLDPRILREARALGEAVIEALQVVGLLAVEMFVTEDGRLMINELAPRPHNSGHYTLDAAATSQFEQLLRAMCQLPPGSGELYAPAAMANLLGHLWPPTGMPDFTQALGVPGVRLYLYGKAEARPGRKMGHLTAVGPTLDIARDRVIRARRHLEQQIPTNPDGTATGRFVEDRVD
jgi:5-(carboxyamino)imidazole ribonucleotide synthase